MLALAGAEAAILSLLLTAFLVVAGLMVMVGLFVFWIWMLVHALRNPGLNDGERISWTVVLCVTHLLGAVLYFFLGRPRAASALNRNGADLRRRALLRPVPPPVPPPPPAARGEATHALTAAGGPAGSQPTSAP
ncbi:PLD nuclease N-terminal domain-containing protein [Limisphaera sp. 4302-co]|uniref:PLD nuclease N-terminal domain-containing protein n=1 Tax=Limisphaera sp. 4302-co TaxID=3400417 RepID=UPI003C1986D2